MSVWIDYYNFCKIRNPARDDRVFLWFTVNLRIKLVTEKFNRNNKMNIMK
jgi:hypothetical protein